MNVIFDLDGVIVNSERSVQCRIQAVLRKYGIPREVDVRKYIGPPPRDCIRELLPECSEGELDKAADYYLRCFENRDIRENSLYPGIGEAIETLFAEGNDLFMVTCRPKKHVILILDYFNISTYFFKVYGNSLSARKSKKKYKLLSEFMDLMLLEKEKTVYIGDTVGDIRAAKDYGIKSMAALWGWGKNEELLNERPDFITMKTTDIVEIIRDENRG